MVSYRTWTRRFGSDPELVGSSVGLGSEAHLVVGVLPQDFALMEPNAEVWTPLRVRSHQADAGGGMVVQAALTGIGRLRAWAAPQVAAVEVDTILRRSGNDGRPIEMRDDYPVRVARLQEERNRTYRPALLMLGRLRVRFC